MPVTKKNRLNRASKAHNKTIRTSKSKRRRNNKTIRTSKSKRSRKRSSRKKSKRSSRKKSKRSSRKKSKKGNSHVMKGGGVTLIDEGNLELYENTYYIFLKGFDSKYEKGESISDVYDEQILTDIKDKFTRGKGNKKNKLCVIWDGDSIHNTKFTRLVEKILKLELLPEDPLKYKKVIVSAIAFKKKSENDEENRKKLQDSMKNDKIDVKFCTIEINDDEINKYFNDEAIKTELPGFAKKFTTLALTIYEHFLKIPNFEFSADNCFFVCLGGGGIAMTEMEVLFGEHTITIQTEEDQPLKDIKFSEPKDFPVKLYPVSRKRIEEFPTLLDFFTQKDDYKKYICHPVQAEDSKNLLVDETEILGYEYTNPIFLRNTDLTYKLNELKTIDKQLTDIIKQLEKADLFQKRIERFGEIKKTQTLQNQKDSLVTQKDSLVTQKNNFIKNNIENPTVQIKIKRVLNEIKGTLTGNPIKYLKQRQDALKGAKTHHWPD